MTVMHQRGGQPFYPTVASANRFDSGDTVAAYSWDPCRIVVIGRPLANRLSDANSEFADIEIIGTFDSPDRVITLRN